MCLGIPGQVVGPLAGDLALVRVEGVDRPVNLGLLDDGPDAGTTVGPGDWVLIHLGFALERIDEATARKSLDFVTGRDGSFADGLG